MLLPSSNLLIFDQFLVPGCCIKSLSQKNSCWAIFVFLGIITTCFRASTIAFMARYYLTVLEEQKFFKKCVERMEGDKSSYPTRYLIWLLVNT